MCKFTLIPSPALLLPALLLLGACGMQPAPRPPGVVDNGAGCMRNSSIARGRAPVSCTQMPQYAQQQQQQR